MTSFTFCTFWESTSSSSTQKRGCDISNLLYILGVHVNSVHAKERTRYLYILYFPGCHVISVQAKERL
jgi:hypothetical protein